MIESCHNAIAAVLLGDADRFSQAKITSQNPTRNSLQLLLKVGTVGFSTAINARNITHKQSRFP